MKNFREKVENLGCIELEECTDQVASIRLTKLRPGKLLDTLEKVKEMKGEIEEFVSGLKTKTSVECSRGHLFLALDNQDEVYEDLAMIDLEVCKKFGR